MLKITVAGADGKEQVIEAEICLVAIGVAAGAPGRCVVCRQEVALTDRGYIATERSV